ncbi:MAG: lipopolysaccharide assembly protein LapB [Pseudomonadales bacterium]|jgi:lipopolysaccharide assembly protein B|uniref:lipopolysaccharide assembly protein LapB n=1 Tax=unclassified Ketobacter TaxID=2639109 RepID=UPI000C690A9B|nr:MULTISPECIES: lipopolysaccharide assembly protein LapB [unclassified Ketobacter]MAQ24888.1 lipopolysaccharide assembly protein LapB [Pseudomonadales bacterium]MEC8810650.1 lipopolysaccharide assembly protein LapB [Pseudomonadota bacterium]HBO92986.1 lipopolysaccharide assembly protein LapB [Gammaproteobacteria bacterium]MBI26737.1 lipopolysaccharide assembly protein LapB [Pseudomonadales bacterium]MCK5789199.1 lipopolysaccharide assembly protein LapB [Ketobacter sp.]|tara:strand:- start:2423 stop:3595 length:1173 start_codon:yes stop_codon:yes gene_type:complete
MVDLFVGILLFVAIVIGWLLGKTERKKSVAVEAAGGVGKEYYDGLNLLLNEKQDEAVDLLLKTLDVNGDTFETHIVMGSLYRRRGEVDRSIRIHQDLLARSDLTKAQHAAVKLELARDYLNAGVLDRSERLLKEIAEEDNLNQVRALEYLLTIYEQEREWAPCIEVAEKLINKGKPLQVKMAHYHCELAEQNLKMGDYVQSRRELKKALQVDKYCVRASMVLAELETEANNPKEAVKALRRVLEQDPAFVPDTLPLLLVNYEKLGNMNDLSKYLFECLEKSPAISIVIELSNLVARLEGDQAGTYVLSEYLKKRPSVKGLDRLISLQMERAGGEEKENLAILQAFTQKLIKDKPIYRCTDCGFDGKTLHWKCPTCKTWGSVRPIQGVEGE